MGACSNGNSIVQNSIKPQKPIPKFDFKVNDRLYERLWKSVELNDMANTEKFLDFNEVFEANLYDLNG